MKTKRNITYIPETGDLDLPYCTGQELMGATRTVVRTLGRGMNVDVVFQGDSAYTNGETVVLPSLPDDAVLTKREGLVCGGYANHETLHNLLTNQASNSTSVAYKRKWHDEGKKFTKSLQNGMEDVRIEHGGTQLYLGLPKAIDKTAHEVTKTFVEDIYPQDNGIVNDIKKIGSVAVTWEGRRRLGYLSEYNQKAMDLLPQHVKEWVNQVVDITMTIPHGVTGMGEIDKSVAFKGSDDLHEIAERIANELADGNYPTEPQYLRILMETENGAKRVTELLLEMDERETVQAMETLKHQMMKALLEITLKGMNEEQKASLLGTIANRMETTTNKVTVTEPTIPNKTK